MAHRARISPPTYTPGELKNVSEFVSYAVDPWAGTQVRLAELTGLAQPTINGLISMSAGPGHKSLGAIARVTGVSIEEILSGVGLVKLRSRGVTAAQGRAQQERVKAARALAELFDLPLSETLELFEEIGLSLPSEVPATTWFDVGRAALERRAAGIALARHI